MVLVGRVLAIARCRLRNPNAAYKYHSSISSCSSSPSPLLVKLVQESRMKNLLDSEPNLFLNHELVTIQPLNTQVLEWKLEKLLKNNERDESCYSHLINLCANLQNLHFALQIFTSMESHGIKPTTAIFNSLIHACLSSNNIITALSLFEIMQRSQDCKPNSSTYNAFISVYSKLGDFKATQTWLTSSKIDGFPPTVETFERLISGYIKAQNIHTANVYYEEMLSSGITPSLSILESMLQGLCQEKNLSKIEEFVKFIIDGGWKINEQMITKFVQVYSVAGMVNQMEELLVTVMRISTDSGVLSRIHHGVIEVYALLDRLDDMEFAIGRMLKQGILFTRPDDVEKIICSYFRREAYERLDLFLERIGESYKLTRSTYDLLISGYRRAALSDKLELVIKEMKMAGF